METAPNPKCEYCGAEIKEEKGDLALRCWHQWRKVMMQDPAPPYMPKFMFWECSEVGCGAKLAQEALDPRGKGGELVRNMRIIGPNKGPVVLDNGDLALDAVIWEDGKVEAKTLSFN